MIWCCDVLVVVLWLKFDGIFVFWVDIDDFDFDVDFCGWMKVCVGCVECWMMKIEWVVYVGCGWFGVMCYYRKIEWEVVLVGCFVSCLLEFVVLWCIWWFCLFWFWICWGWFCFCGVLLRSILCWWWGWLFFWVFCLWCCLIVFFWCGSRYSMDS